MLLTEVIYFHSIIFMFIRIGGVSLQCRQTVGAKDSICQCMAAYCAAVCDNVWQRVTVYDNLWQYMAAYGSIWQPVAVYGSLWQYIAACGSIWQPVAVYGSV